MLSRRIRHERRMSGLEGRRDTRLRFRAESYLGLGRATQYDFRERVGFSVYSGGLVGVIFEGRAVLGRSPSAPQLVVLILAGREYAASVLSVGYLGPAEKHPDFAYEPCAVAISAALRGVLIFVFV